MNDAFKQWAEAFVKAPLVAVPLAETDEEIPIVVEGEDEFEAADTCPWLRLDCR